MARPTATRIVVVKNPQGLHARPADMLVRRANEFSCDLLLEKEGQQVDCKSILSILTLGAAQGTELSLTARGGDAKTAIDAIAELFENGFYEDSSTDSQSSATEPGSSESVD